MKGMRELTMWISRESVPDSRKSKYSSPEVGKWHVSGKAKELVWLKCSEWQMAK